MEGRLKKTTEEDEEEMEDNKELKHDEDRRSMKHKIFVERDHSKLNYTNSCFEI